MEDDDFRFKIIADEGCTDCGLVTDINGNVYQTIQIGDQCWMAENLKVTHYRNGDPIPHLTSDDDWANTSSGAYCVYDNIASNVEAYGNLYNWYSANDPRGLAPEGWHIPTDEEIMELEIYLGMSESEAGELNYRGSNEGSKLAGRADLWIDGVLEINPEFNKSCFTFLPGGYRSGGPEDFYNMNGAGSFWSSTANTEYNNAADYRGLVSASTKIARYYTFVGIGFSVRCIKD